MDVGAQRSISASISANRPPQDSRSLPSPSASAAASRSCRNTSAKSMTSEQLFERALRRDPRRRELARPRLSLRRRLALLRHGGAWRLPRHRRRPRADRFRLHVGSGDPRPQSPGDQGRDRRALENGTSFGTPNPYEVEMAELIVRFVRRSRRCACATAAPRRPCRRSAWRAVSRSATRSSSSPAATTGTPTRF